MKYPEHEQCEPWAEAWLNIGAGGIICLSFENFKMESVYRLQNTGQGANFEDKGKD